MTKKSLILFSFLLLMFQATWAQTAAVQSFSLKEAVEYAKKNNFTLQNSKLDVLASQKKVNEIFSYGLPQVSASANLINNTQIPVQVIPNFLQSVMGGPDNLNLAFGRPFTSGITVSANQLLFDGTFFRSKSLQRICEPITIKFQ